jgi:Fur family ferric uptake transcriptional regulator
VIANTNQSRRTGARSATWYKGAVAQERSTRQKRALAAVLDASDEFRSAQDLHAALQAEGQNMALTTIYNQLRSLAEAGDIDALRGDDGETRYRRCATDEHHHHLVCRHCGRAVEVEGPEVERWAARTGRNHGFRDVTHTVEVLGTCPECAAADGPDRSAPPPSGRRPRRPAP